MGKELVQTEPISKTNFWNHAKRYIATKRSGEELPVIKPGSLGWLLWCEYFLRHLQWAPFLLRELIDNPPKDPKGFTVPTLDPHIFDPSFAPQHGWHLPRKQLLAKSQRETLEQLRQRFGPNWGLKVINDEQKKREWKSPDWKDLVISPELTQNIKNRK